MISTRKLLNVRGYNVRAHITFCVTKSLTEEVDDVIFECVDDFLQHDLPTSELVDTQQTLVEVLHYYLQDTLTPETCLSYSIVGDDRNNPAEKEGLEFAIEVKFTAKRSLIPTRIQYIIEY